MKNKKNKKPKNLKRLRAFGRPVSGKPRKQRKFRSKAPLHLRKKFLHVHLSKNLRSNLKTKKRSLLINKDDTVRIMTGRYKGKRGKIVEVSYLKLKIYIEGVTNTNVRGQEKNIPIEPSNVELTALNMTGHRKAVFKEVVK